MDPIIRKFSRHFDLSDDERTVLNGLTAKSNQISANTVIVSAGDPCVYTYLVQSGWCMIYKLLPDGSLQILSYAIPGDFLDLFGVVLNRSEHSIQAITDSRICPIREEQILELFRNYPRLALTICWFGARDQILLREQIARIGRQSAYNRISHLILELHDRLHTVGLADNDSFIFPVTQEMLADTLGLTPVHVNRTLKKLRNNGLMDISDQRVHILDKHRLMEETRFDPSYLEDAVVPDDITSQPVKN